MKEELFGTMFRPNARWTCKCGRKNVSRLAPPLRAKETLHCGECHRTSIISIDLKTVPKAWGGQA